MAEEDKDRKIEELAERIAELEASIRLITKPYADLVEQMDRVQGIVSRYFGLLDIYQTHGGISIDVIIPQVEGSHIQGDRPHPARPSPIEHKPIGR